MKLKLALIVLIFAGFIFTRLYKINSIPPSLYWDEASIGYNARLINYDLKDEWNNFLPIHFRAFGEFKLPVFIYSVSLVGKLVGNTPFAVRITSVIYSLLTLIMVYLIGKKVFKNEAVGLLTVFVMATTPWFFIFSRTGYEATSGLFFYLVFIYFIFKIKEETHNYLYAFIALVAAIYSYNSIRVLSLILIPCVLIYPLFLISKTKKFIFFYLISIFFLIFSLFPIVKLYLFDSGLARLSSVESGQSGATKYIQWINNMATHFNYKYLFLNGDSNIRSTNPNFGVLLIFSAPFLVYGLYYLVKYRYKYGLLLISLLFLGLLPSAITKEAPHSLRSLTSLPFFCFIIALGAYNASNMVKGMGKNIIILFFILGSSINFYIYFKDFIKNYSNKADKDWQHPYKVLSSEYLNHFVNASKICITDKYGQPYIYLAYYTNISYESVRNATLNPVSDWGQSRVKSLSNKYFFIKDIDPNCDVVFYDREINNYLYKKIDIIKTNDGRNALWIYQKS